jgi:hypothetical protein
MGIRIDSASVWSPVLLTVSKLEGEYLIDRVHVVY